MARKKSVHSDACRAAAGTAASAAYREHRGKNPHAAAMKAASAAHRDAVAAGVCGEPEPAVAELHPRERRIRF